MFHNSLKRLENWKTCQNKGSISDSNLSVRLPIQKTGGQTKNLPSSAVHIHLKEGHFSYKNIEIFHLLLKATKKSPLLDENMDIFHFVLVLFLNIKTCSMSKKFSMCRKVILCNFVWSVKTKNCKKIITFIRTQSHKTRSTFQTLLFFRTMVSINKTKRFFQNIESHSKNQALSGYWMRTTLKETTLPTQTFGNEQNLTFQAFVKILRFFAICNSGSKRS
jgi:hypothetical protein